ncbi:unnamed protein product, partial [marine sediment metagenome]
MVWKNMHIYFPEFYDFFNTDFKDSWNDHTLKFFDNGYGFEVVLDQRIPEWLRDDDLKEGKLTDIFCERIIIPTRDNLKREIS